MQLRSLPFQWAPPSFKMSTYLSCFPVFSRQRKNLLKWGISLLPFCLNSPVANAYQESVNRQCRMLCGKPSPSTLLHETPSQCKRKEVTLTTGRYSCSFQHPSTWFTQGGVRFSLVDEPLFPCRSRTRPLTFHPVFPNDRRLHLTIPGLREADAEFRYPAAATGIPPPVGLFKSLPSPFACGAAVPAPPCAGVGGGDRGPLTSGAGVAPFGT